jgi:hypothetical protein
MPVTNFWKDLSVACLPIVRRLLLLASLGAALGFVGCGGRTPTGEVSGKITIMGESPRMKGLQISFIAPNGRIVGAPINEDGTYRASDVPVGEAQIGFIYTPPAMEQGSQGKKRFPGKGDPDAQVPEEAPNPIPEPLRDGSTSNLTVRVLAGQNQAFDFDMK